VQRAGEQQEREHPVHQQIAEVDLVHQRFDAILEAWVADETQALQDQREHQSSDHHADGRRQADEAEVHVGEQCGEANECRDYLEHPGSLGQVLKIYR